MFQFFSVNFMSGLLHGFWGFNTTTRLKKDYLVNCIYCIFQIYILKFVILKNYISLAYANIL